MDRISGWQELKTDRKKQCPKLFYNYVADEHGYTLQFTDLIALWTATATADDVRNRARENRTSIDASQSSQLLVLLRKLKESLAQGSNVLKKDLPSNSETVLLETTLNLPRPLEPLKWQFVLERQGSGEMAEHILRPCLYEASESMKKIDTLISTIEAKDRVILRLVQKIEASSMDLSLIFPGITGPRARKGQVTVQDAERHVPGLRKFHKREWQDFFKSDSDYANFETAGLFTLAVKKCPKHTPQQHEKWLDKLPKATATTSQVVQAAWYRSSSPVRPSDSESDEFETQKKRPTEIVQRRDGHMSSDTESDDGGLADRDDPSPRGQRLGLDGSGTRSPIGSSPPPLPPLPSKHSRSGSGSSPPTEVPLSQYTRNKPKTSFGKLGAKPRATRAGSPRTIQPSSSSPIPSIPITKSQLESSSPAPNPPLESDKPPHFPSSVATASNPSTPRKLGRLRGSQSVAEAITPKTTKADTGDLPTTQTTPIHNRLGRLRRGSSQVVSQSQHPTQKTGADLDIEMQDVTANESDASTASTASTSTPPARKKSQSKHSSPPQPQDGIDEVTLTSQSQQLATQKQEEQEPEEELTKEEKAKRRREELKRKIGDTNATTTGTGPAGAAGLRKKRKF